jgi:DNA-binding Lrp family transcriptional regulator
VEIDEIDVKILRELIRDSRIKLKDVAKRSSIWLTGLLRTLGGRNLGEKRECKLS